MATNRGIFTINPFSLEPTRDNLQFLYSLFRVLIEGERYKLDFKEERQLYSAIERMYVLEPDQRTVSDLAEIVGELKDRLHRWARAGQYGFLFDNVKDTLMFSQFQTFNFNGWNDTPELDAAELPIGDADGLVRCRELNPVARGELLLGLTVYAHPGKPPRIIGHDRPLFSRLSEVSRANSSKRLVHSCPAQYR